MEQKSVIEIRNSYNIPNSPIIYYWCFHEACISILLSKLSDQINYDKISQIVNLNNGEIYWLLYIGKGKKGNERLKKYHILDSNNFHQTGIENGRLSSLRTTLCGLLDLPMSKSKKEIDDFIDENCIVQWAVCKLEELDTLEENLIKSNYLPLNYQNTKGILTKKHRKILRNCKSQMRK